MKSGKFLKEFLFAIVSVIYLLPLYIGIAAFVFILPYQVIFLGFKLLVSHIEKCPYYPLSIFSILVETILVILFFFYCKISSLKEEVEAKKKNLEGEYRQKRDGLEEQYRKKQKELDDYVDRKDAEIKAKENKVNRCRDRMEQIFVSSTPFSNSASIASDMHTYVFDEWKFELKHKNHPALKSAEIVSMLKRKSKEMEADRMEMLYKYEFLLSVFPELRRYVDDEESLLHVQDSEGIDDFKDNRDKSIDYLTNEEWNSLSEIERNQLALDRYKNKTKSKWTIGMMYEMFIGHLLRGHFDVIQYGINAGLNDLGRDIIAKKTGENGQEYIYIIQCKNWSCRKEIHENVVCQIFGTSVEYELSLSTSLSNKPKVIPVLYVTTNLSDTAMKFAKKLGVRVLVVPLGEYPMIKCNVNNGRKIYHLPFDQQYWRTKIENEGEFYAWTVKEAVDAGFRRALKYHF